ncbi:MAG: CDP-diacylglycerol--glycerol-3-phosphate 3-phosphatidyltransferase [Acidobacteriaceae bacterium]|nr:CDP-diacylglycerol--glycerol-3-phosphate 3-phosphatidyltransferase [Acidobacteriaceae bacterium]
MNLPNALTLLRIFFVPLLVAALVQRNLTVHWNGDVWITNEYLALTIFLFAAATDLVDGYLARKWGQITTVGTLLDPIADKLLISAALIALVQVHKVPAWIVILIVGREFAVSGLRSIAAAEGYTIKASELGKTKMISQVLAVALMLLSVHWPELSQIATICIWGAMIFSLASAVDYFWKFWRKIDDHVKRRRRRELLMVERRRNRSAII